MEIYHRRFMRYFVRFSYNGTDFHGSQTQPNGITVQEVMEKTFSTILREPIALTFAGRTDAGVHAREMWAHFDFENPMVSPPSLISRFNSLLPSSVAVQAIMPVQADAHARFDACARTYYYYITTEKDPFSQHLCTRVAPGLDFEAMNEAAKLLLGRHDFASFCRVHTDVKTTFCTVTKAEWSQTPSLGGGVGSAFFAISADRFLRNMVRAVVGTLFMVGRHQLTVEQFASVIEQHDRCAAGQSAPADGLYLVKVDYPKELFVV